jgi:hypothetical protein
VNGVALATWFMEHRRDVPSGDRPIQLVAGRTNPDIAATRSVVFAGDRIVLASRVGMHKVENAQVPVEVYQLLSLDRQTGKIRDSREFLAFNSLKVFATNDEHVVVSGGM